MCRFVVRYLQGTTSGHEVHSSVLVVLVFCIVESCPPPDVFRVDISSRVEEQLGDVRFPSKGSELKRRRTIITFSIDICSAVDEHLGGLQLPVESSEVERCTSKYVSRIDIYSVTSVPDPKTMCWAGALLFMSLYCGSSLNSPICKIVVHV